MDLVLLPFVLHPLLERLTLYLGSVLAAKKRDVSHYFEFLWAANNQNSNNGTENVQVWFTRWQSGVVLL